MKKFEIITLLVAVVGAFASGYSFGILRPVSKASKPGRPAAEWETLNDIFYSCQKEPLFPTRKSIVEGSVARLPEKFELIETVDFDSLNLAFFPLDDGKISNLFDRLWDYPSYGSALTLAAIPEYAIKFKAKRRKQELNYVFVVSTDEALLSVYLNGHHLNETSLYLDPSFSTFLRGMIAETLNGK